MRLGHLLHLISPPRAVLLLCLLLSCVGSVLSLVNPWIAGQLTGFITGSNDLVLTSFAAIAASWAGVLLLRSALGLYSAYRLGSVAEAVLTTLRSRLYEHLQLLPISYYDEQKRGNVLSLLTNDAAIVSHFVTGTLVQIVPMLTTFVGAAALMLWLSWKIALLTLALLPAYFLAMKVVGRKLRPLSRQWVEAYSNMVAHAEENLGLLPAIKSFTREALELASFNSKSELLLTLSKQQLLIYTLLPALTSLLAGLGLLALVWLGYNDIAAGTLSPATLVSLLFLAMQMNQPLAELANVYGQLQATRGATDRLLDFLSQVPEPFNEPLPPLVVSNGNIELRDVSFTYPTGAGPVLRAVNLQITQEVIAIVGENGAGKSTLAHLLMRLIAPTAGVITIDGTDISQVSLRSLRAHIGLVAQHTLLLNSSVADNIAWGLAGATQATIEQAAKAACAHDFILALPKGYQTIIGDQGLKLSGGQRQRVSLARALLKNPPILILDEATSMFDPAAEAAFLRDCEAHFAKRTVILITHRPASLAVANRVLRLKDGQLSQVQDVDRYLKTGEA